MSVTPTPSLPSERAARAVLRATDESMTDENIELLIAKFSANRKHFDALCRAISESTRCDSLAEQLRIADEASSFHMQLSAKLTQQNDSLSAENKALKERLGEAGNLLDRCLSLISFVEGMPMSDAQRYAIDLLERETKAFLQKKGVE